MSDAQALEKRLATISPGRRVSLKDIEDNIISEHYFTASQGVDGAKLMDMRDDTPEKQLVLLPVDKDQGPPPESLTLLTFCVLELKNGFTVHGTSACADPANYNQEIGEKIARQNAVAQIWPLMGYALKERMYAEAELMASKAFWDSPDMTTYIGTKVVHAEPMTRGDYNLLRGWTIPINENPDDAGYLVEYTDQILDKPMVEGYFGYVSWSPKEVFERAYRAVATPAASRSAATAREQTGMETREEASTPGFVERMKKERHDLANKIQALTGFINSKGIFQELVRDEQMDLHQQESFMRGYLIMLDRRLARYV